MPIKYERVSVTPKLAAEWLTKNAENNRVPKKSRIPAYARDMVSGRWNSDSGETIKFDAYGTLIDGQNRLRAVVLAGQANPNIVIDFDVARGLPTEAIRVIDSGASRIFADTLAFDGVTDRNRVGSVVRWVLNWEVGNYMGSGKFSPTTAELWDRYRMDADLFTAAALRGSDATRQGLGVAAAAGTAFYLFYTVDRDAASTFFDRYVSGAGLQSGSPILVLRNRMARVRLDRTNRQEQLALTVKAWNHWRDGREVSAILMPKGELTNLNFPRPK